MTEHVLERSQLGTLGDLLGEGGQAKIFRAPRLSLPDAPGPLVFKQYKQGHTPPHGLHALVARRRGLEPAKLARLDSLAAWPLRIVQDEGAVCGAVLPLIPDSYFQPRVLPGTGKRERGPREIQNLFVDPSLARHVGMPEVTLAQRLQVCRDFASALHLMHGLDLVVGDLNPKNALFRLDGRPSVMLLDCDSIRIKGSMAVVAQLNFPDWTPPEGAVLSQATDRYKFGLFVLRCLSPGPQASTWRDPQRADAVLDDEGRGLLRAALGDRPADRPTAQDWGFYLHWRVTGQRVAPPWVTHRTATALVPPAPAPAARAPEGSTRGWKRDPVTGAWRPAS